MLLRRRASGGVVGGANDGYVAGSWGYQMGLNSVNPATDQGGFKLPNFGGLWPAGRQIAYGLVDAPELRDGAQPAHVYS